MSDATSTAVKDAAFHARIVEAFRVSKQQSKRPFFAGQRLRRLVREALESYDAC